MLVVLESVKTYINPAQEFEHVKGYAGFFSRANLGVAQKHVQPHKKTRT